MRRFAATCALLALSGCGGGGDSTPIPIGTTTPPPAATSEAVAFQNDASHSGVSGAATPAFPLPPAWQRTFPGTVSYPLIAGGKVFVIVSLSGANGSVQLVAIDQESGLDAWSVSVGTSFLASHAYDQGLVYVTGTDNLLRAFDASTGALKWSTLVPYNQGVSPIARDGKVYLSSGNLAYAVDGKSGAILWTASSGSTSAASLSASGVLLSSYCQSVALLQSTGAQLWSVGPLPGCVSGSPSTIVHANGRAYVRDYDFVNARPSLIARDADTGAVVGTANVFGYSTLPIPAVGADAAYVLNGGTLQRFDPSLQTVSWSFAGDATLTSAPLVVGGVVLVGGNSGKLYALDTTSGAERWSTLVPSAIETPQDGYVTLLTGMAAANGILAVPNGRNLSTWRLRSP